MSISNPQNNHQFQEQTLNLNVDPQPVASSSAEHVKRRPGRPKGSTKKTLLGTASPSPAKAKRPVGRPRKDGLPAGSVGPSRKREKPASSVSNVPLRCKGWPNNSLLVVLLARTSGYQLPRSALSSSQHRLPQPRTTVCTRSCPPD